MLIGFADIFPEFLSLWLFNRKLLTDEMVVSHLNRIPVMLPRSELPIPRRRRLSKADLHRTAGRGGRRGATSTKSGTRWSATPTLPAMQAKLPTACTTTAGVG